MPWYLRLPLLVASLYGFAVLAIYFLQDRMMFFPRTYSERALSGFEPFHYEAVGGEHTAALVGNLEKPSRVWIVFGGNGSLALNFLDLAHRVVERDPTGCVLLVDYPGYGNNPGRPGRASIQKATDALWETLPSTLGLSPPELTSRTSVLGHSLGAAVGMEFAAKWEISSVIAISPFTSMQEMANRQVSRALAIGLKHRWDNRAALDRIVGLEGAFVHIYHGERDRLIPASMGRDLRDRHPLNVGYFPIPNAGHNDAIDQILPQLVDRMGGAHRAESPR